MTLTFHLVQGQIWETIDFGCISLSIHILHEWSLWNGSMIWHWPWSYSRSTFLLARVLSTEVLTKAFLFFHMVLVTSPLPHHDLDLWPSLRLDLVIFFSSPEPKARVSYCHSASSVRPLVVVRKLFTFSTSSPKPLDGFWWNLVGMTYSWSLTSVVVFRPDPPRGGSRVGPK